MTVTRVRTQMDKTRQLVKNHLANTRIAPPSYTQAQLAAHKQEIADLLQATNAVIVAHYYTNPLIQALAEETGGCVADSLEMARFGQQHEAETLIVAGVKFMGETAKILTPHKRVLMPTLEATCSLDLGCPVDEFSRFCDQYPEREVVVYANTSAAVKARADWVVTSSIALDIVDHLDSEGKQLIWAPDKHLGHYVQQKTGADMLLWDGACIVHEEFKAQGITTLKDMHPEAAVLAHPESPQAVIAIADVVGSTSQLIRASQTLSQQTFIVATDEGIFYKMQQLSPHKQFFIAPTAGNGATCRSCANCPWMAMNHLDNITDALRHGHHEVHVDPVLGIQAMKPLQRMLAFPSSTV